MTAGYIALAIAGMALLTAFSRASFSFLPSDFQMPTAVERALRFAPACALAAIVAPALLVKGTDVSVSFDNHRLWAALPAAAVFLRTRNMLAMMGVGMAMLALLEVL